MPDTLLLLAIILAAGLIQGVSGFGFGLFAMGVMALIMPVTDAVVIVAIVTLSSISLNLWSVREDIPWRDTWPIILGAIPTTIVGVLLLRNLDSSTLRIGIAVMILGGCAVSMWHPDRAMIHRAFPGAHIAGFVGGLFGGALNIGGPPVVLYSLLRGWDKGEAKGVMSAYFFVTGVLRVVLHIAAGTATWPLVRQSLLLIIPTVAASYLGVLIFRRLSNRAFRFAITGLLVFLAVRVFTG
jgi:uncharacterized protein